MLAGTTPTTPIMVIGSPSPPTGSLPEPSTVALIVGALAFAPAQRSRTRRRAGGSPQAHVAET